MDKKLKIGIQIKRIKQSNEILFLVSILLEEGVYDTPPLIVTRYKLKRRYLL